LPPLSAKCTPDVTAGIEALRGARLPTDYAVDRVSFHSELYAVDLRTKDGVPFWCLVEATTPSSSLFRPGAYALVEFVAPH